MIQFLQPIWLWAMTAVLIPVVIHLWNIREGKTLKVGSIAFLTEATRSHARSVRLSELLLLLLRCLLLVLIALLLARPVWTGPSEAGKQQGWIMLPPAIAPKMYAQFQPAIDSLHKQGYSFHRFQTGFAEMQSPADTANGEEATNYWQLLAALNQQLPAGSPAWLFTDNQRRHFTGPRPAVSLDLHWQTFSLPDTASWQANTFRTNSDSTRIITALSSSKGMSYAAKTVAAADTDTSALLICIYSDVYAADANYLRAALAATRDFTQRKIKILLVDKADELPDKTDWLFWLSDKPAGNHTARHLFAYGSGKTRSIHATLNTGDNISGLLCYRVTDNATQLLPVWTTGANQVVLGIDPGKENALQFNSRFHPQWNDLVWSDQFPKLVAELILEKPANADALSLSAVDQQQLQPQKVDATMLLPREIAAAGSALDAPGWLLVIVCLFVERWLSFRTKSTRA